MAKPKAKKTEKPGPFSRFAHARISIGHCSSRVRERAFCTAKTAPYGSVQAATLLPETEKKRRAPMKAILSALLALSVIAGVAGSASALDAKTFYEQVDRNHF